MSVDLLRSNQHKSESRGHLGSRTYLPRFGERRPNGRRGKATSRNEDLPTSPEVVVQRINNERATMADISIQEATQPANGLTSNQQSRR